jgi:hypothetical protein
MKDRRNLVTEQLAANGVTELVYLSPLATYTENSKHSLQQWNYSPPAARRKQAGAECIVTPALTGGVTEAK